MKNMKQGEYLITTINKKEYKIRQKEADKTRPGHLKKITKEATNRNLNNCNKKIRITRKPWKMDSDLLVNFTKKMEMIPNILILDIQTREESKNEFPEYWL